MRYTKYVTHFIILAAVLSLSGCITPEQRVQMARNQCESFGFTPGTDRYARCVQKQNNQMIKNNLQEQNNFEQQRIADEIASRHHHHHHRRY